MRTNKLSVVKRIFWNWLRIALALEAALAATMIYLGFRSGVVAYRDAGAVENFALYSALAIGASGVIAVTETLISPER
ncbi:hypothetical protein [Phenylobacterium sp.]|uniref:hypothetical protein n=1 Tax=Phenylobacterium sp. TaxID=1871053 RepID=UPI002FCC3E5A